MPQNPTTFATPEPATSRVALDAAELINERAAKALLGGVSDMWMWRRDNDPTSGFPAPIRIGARKYRRLSELRAWIDAKARESIRSLDRPGQPRRAA